MDMKNIIIIWCLLQVLLLSSCQAQEQADSLENLLRSEQSGDTLSIMDVSDFEWDEMYFIAPYLDREEIQRELGISSSEVMDSVMYDSGLYLVFLNKGEYVYQIQGTQQSLGFDIDVGEYDKYKKLTKEEAVFEVTKEEGFVTYQLIQK